VLIFSQFKIMLNVLEDYLRLAGYPFERIDGDVKSRDRQNAIDRFSKGAPLSRMQESFRSLCLGPGSDGFPFAWQLNLLKRAFFEPVFSAEQGQQTASCSSSRHGRAARGSR
jgi:hypothetical protein